MKLLLGFKFAAAAGILIGLGYSVQGLLCVLAGIILFCTIDIEKAIKEN